jgi:hypothetical protein
MFEKVQKGASKNRRTEGSKENPKNEKTGKTCQKPKKKGKKIALPVLTGRGPCRTHGRDAFKHARRRQIRFAAGASSVPLHRVSVGLAQVRLPLQLFFYFMYFIIMTF